MKWLEREVSEDTELIHQRDGSVKVFHRMQVMGELYLARLDAAIGRAARSSEVMEALEGATPESRREVVELSEGPYYSDLEPGDATAPAEDRCEP